MVKHRRQGLLSWLELAVLTIQACIHWIAARVSTQPSQGHTWTSPEREGDVYRAYSGVYLIISEYICMLINDVTLACHVLIYAAYIYDVDFCSAALQVYL